MIWYGVCYVRRTARVGIKVTLQMHWYAQKVTQNALCLHSLFSFPLGCCWCDTARISDCSTPVWKWRIPNYLFVLICTHLHSFMSNLGRFYSNVLVISIRAGIAGFVCPITNSFSSKDETKLLNYDMDNMDFNHFIESHSLLSLSFNLWFIQIDHEYWSAHLADLCIFTLFRCICCWESLQLCSEQMAIYTGTISHKRHLVS